VTPNAIFISEKELLYLAYNLKPKLLPTVQNRFVACTPLYVTISNRTAAIYNYS